MVRTDNDRFMFRLAQGNLLRASTISTIVKVDLSSNSLCNLAHSSVMLFGFFNRFRVQTVATVMKATGGGDNPSSYARIRTLFSLRTTLSTIHLILRH